LPDITHVVIAAGDSDYIALAQRAKRLGRYIVGVGVAGGTSKSLAAACNEYADYDSLPGIRPASHIAAHIAAEPVVTPDDAPPTAKGARRASKAGTTADPEPSSAADGASTGTGTGTTTETPTSKRAASALLVRALRLVHEADDADWAHASALKNQMKRLDPAFNEKALGYSTFSKFVKSRANIVELDESTQIHLVRLRE